jgi:hypothetical protein
MHNDWWKGLSDKKRFEIPPCLVALFHHFIIVPYGLYLIYRTYAQGITLTQADAFLVAPFCYGYLAGDTLFYAIPEARQGHYEYILHHALGLWITAAAVNATTPEVLTFIPSMFICELSSIFLAVGWVMRCTSHKDMPIINYLNIAFALSFFVTRVVNLPIAVWKTWEAAVEIGLARYTLIPILAMQFYWFYKIIISVTKPKGEKAITAAKKTQKAH